ncbi:MAG: SCO family protein [Thermoanaerobaculum sp.]|nr:SCO family protein [Thermoanaerobaculum sp.]MDW7966564.1 SCO family protein [Thermoanaerobaculum sp.]
MKRALSLCLLMVAAAPVWAQRAEPLPKELEGVGIEDRPGAQVPLDAVFFDEDGREVQLGSLVAGKPTILALVYYRCPMLCGLVLQGLLEGLKGLPQDAGKSFQVVTISIDPLETPTLARLKKQTYLAEYGRPGAAEGWRFLTGREREIRRVADSVGFSYRWNEQRQEYAHGAGLFVLTPKGTLARTLYGVMFQPRTLQLALSEAREGKTSLGEKILLYCFHYDAEQGRYVVAAQRLMRLGGLTTVVVLGTWLVVSWRRQRREGS